MKKSAARKKSSRVVTNTAGNREQRGMSKVLILALVAIILLACGGFYFLSQKSGIAVPGMKAALNPNCKQNDPELCKFLNNWAGKRAYSVTSKSDIGGMKTESLMKMTADSKLQMISKQDDKEISNTISIGDTTYTLDYKDNKWWKQTSKLDETEIDSEIEDKEYEGAMNDDIVEDNTQYKFIAKEACGDLTCFKYEIVMADPSGMTSFLWFDDKDYLTRKMRMEDSSGKGSESLYEYDNVSVSIPSPVKEGNPYSAGDTPSDAEVQKMMQQYQQQADTSTESEAPVEDTSSDGF